jgi:AAHS family 4-hydroxybenzoate transporter-like MFS transporter
LLPFGFASFLAFGLVLVLVGANQTYLARDLGLDLSRSGLLASVLSLGLGVGVVGAGPLFDRFPRKPLFAGSLLLAAAALGSVERDMSFQHWLAHLALAGLGIGAYDTLVNAVVVQRFAERAARPMAAVHAAATLGAMSGPPLVGWLAGQGDWVRSFHAAGLAHAVLAAVALVVRFPPPDPRPAAGTAGLRIPPALVPIALIAFVYVGIESGLTVFALPYAAHLGLDAARGQLGISAFWLGLLSGRVGVLTLRRALDARVLAGAGLAGASVLGLASLAPTGQVEGTLFTAGLVLGCVYPLMIALAGQVAPHARGTAAGLAAGAGALGGFGVPWLAGAIGDAAGVGSAIASLALCSALIAVFAWMAMRVRRIGQEG